MFYIFFFTNKTVPSNTEYPNATECLKAFLFTHPHAVAVMNKKLEIEFINHELENILGYDLKKIKGLRLSDMLKKFSISLYNSSQIISMEEAKSIRTDLLTGKEHMICLLNKNKEKIILSIKAHILDSGDTLIIFVKDNNVLTISNMKSKLNTIINNIDNFVINVDKNGIITSCNDSFYKLTGTKQSEVVGISLKQICEILNFCFAGKGIMERGLSRDCSKTREAIIKSLDQKEKSIVFRVLSLNSENNKNMESIIIGSEKYFSKETQENLQHQEKLAVMGQLGSGIVHETKNMLATMKGYCQLIDLKSDEEHVKNYTKRMENIADSLNVVITEFLSLAKPGSNKFNKISLNEIIISIKYMLESPSFLRGIKFKLELTDYEKPVYADKCQIKQVILNMVKNAIEAMEHTENPLLVISTHLSFSEEEMIIKVSDNGKGFPKKELSKIFKPFYTTKEYGTGLGLDTCHRVIESHMGKISVKSITGKGTTFKVSIPCWDTHDMSNKL